MTPHKCEGFDATDSNGNAYVYSIKELEVEDYQAHIGPMTNNKVIITNIFVIPKTSVEVHKIWTNSP